MILSFVWAGLAALGLLCAMVWYNGGVVIGASPEALLSLTVTGSLKQMMSVHTESGSLQITVAPTDAPDRFCYRGMDLPTSDFSVILSEPGEYQVWIAADHFMGNYAFQWTAS